MPTIRHQLRPRFVAKIFISSGWYSFFPLAPWRHLFFQFFYNEWVKKICQQKTCFSKNKKNSDLQISGRKLLNEACALMVPFFCVSFSEEVVFIQFHLIGCCSKIFNAGKCVLCVYVQCFNYSWLICCYFSSCKMNLA